MILHVTKVKLAPGTRPPAPLIGRKMVPRCSAKPTLRVLVERNVFDLIGEHIKYKCRVLIPARHLPIWADLIPEDYFPGLCVGVFGTVQLRDVFVVRGVGLGVEEDDVATPRVANIAFVADVIALGLRASAETVPGKLAVGRGLVPGCGCFDGVRAGLVIVAVGIAAVGMAAMGMVTVMVVTMGMTSVVTAVRARTIVRIAVRAIGGVIVGRSESCTREDVERSSERTDTDSIFVDVDKSTRLKRKAKADVVVVVVVVVLDSGVLAMDEATMMALEMGKG